MLLVLGILEIIVVCVGFVFFNFIYIFKYIFSFLIKKRVDICAVIDHDNIV